MILIVQQINIEQDIMKNKMKIKDFKFNWMNKQKIKDNLLEINFKSIQLIKLLLQQIGILKIV